MNQKQTKILNAVKIYTKIYINMMLTNIDTQYLFHVKTFVGNRRKKTLHYLKLHIEQENKKQLNRSNWKGYSLNVYWLHSTKLNMI